MLKKTSTWHYVEVAKLYLNGCSIPQDSKSFQFVLVRFFLTYFMYQWNEFLISADDCDTYLID